MAVDDRRMQKEKRITKKFIRDGWNIISYILILLFYLAGCLITGGMNSKILDNLLTAIAIFYLAETVLGRIGDQLDNLQESTADNLTISEDYGVGVKSRQ